MSITFYEAPFSSATPVTCALAELSVPHTRVRLDLQAGEQKKAAFLKINPNGKVPTLVVDGTPMFEGLGIVLWLSDRYGVAQKLWPAAESPQRLEALSWTVWSYVSMAPTVQRMLYASGERLGADFHNAAQVDLARQDADRLLGVLDARLAQKPYVLGDEFSLADLVLGCTLTWATYVGISTASHGHVQAWLARCQERPSFKAAWGGAH